MKHDWETNFGAEIARRWRERFPEETRALERAGLLEKAADRAAHDAAAQLCEARLKYQFSFEQAEALARARCERPPAGPVRVAG
jgi:hypothetical protein